jgi:hypothetical protein
MLIDVFYQYNQAIVIKTLYSSEYNILRLNPTFSYSVAHYNSVGTKGLQLNFILTSHNNEKLIVLIITM